MFTLSLIQWHIIGAWWGGGTDCAVGDAGCGGGAAPSSPPLPPLPEQPEPRLALLWATPVLYSSLPAAAALRLNVELFHAIESGVADFRKTSGPLSRGSGRNGLNERLFALQQQQHDSGTMWEPMLYSAAAEKLRVRMAEHALGYLAQLGRAEKNETVATLANRIFMWVSIHEGCSAHMPHVHESSSVSGVYYVHVPPGSGSLVLEDSRGARTPFGNRVVHEPRAGEFVVFPPWLIHHVQSTCGGDSKKANNAAVGVSGARISISFNVAGDWTRTADSSIEIPVDPALLQST